MKKKVGLILISMMLVSQGFARTNTLPEPRQVISLQGLDAQMIREIVQGEHPDLAVKCEEGNAIPLEFLHKFSFFSMKLNPNFSIKVDQSCYFRFCNKKVYMSYDLNRWEKPNTFDGKFSVDVKQNENKTGLVLETTLTPYPED